MMKIWLCVLKMVLCMCLVLMGNGIRLEWLFVILFKVYGIGCWWWVKCRFLILLLFVWLVGVIKCWLLKFMIFLMLNWNKLGWKFWYWRLFGMLVWRKCLFGWLSWVGRLWLKICIVMLDKGFILLLMSRNW